MLEELNAVREQATAIAHEAGALLMQGFLAAPSVRAKRTASDLVTEHDERCEAFVRERLGHAFPGVSVIGEETGGQSASEVWYVDPIDGTSNFAHGHPFFCISLGLWQNGAPLCGVVHAPAMGLTFSAARGLGATRNDVPCRVSNVRELGSALLATGFPADRSRNYREYAHLDRNSHGVRRCGAAALELSLVAQGAYDGFWDFGLSPWDLAAGVLFVLEAGGTVTDLDGRPIRLDAPSVLATNGALHEPLLLALAHAGALPPIDGGT